MPIHLRHKLDSIVTIAQLVKAGPEVASDVGKHEGGEGCAELSLNERQLTFTCRILNP
jgi:hypothetical protein